MKVELTKQEVITLWNALNSLKRIKHTKFAYFIARNSGHLKAEVDALTEVQKPDEKIQEYEQKRMELIKKYSAKDEHGAPIQVSPGSFKIGNMDKFESDVAVLDKEYFETLEENKRKNKEFVELLKEKTSIEMHGYKFSDLPDEIDGNEMEQIMKLVSDLP